MDEFPNNFLGKQINLLKGENIKFMEYSRAKSKAKLRQKIIYADLIQLLTTNIYFFAIFISLCQYFKMVKSKLNLNIGRMLS